MQDISSVFKKSDALIRKVLDAIPLDEMIEKNPGYERYAQNRFNSFIEIEKARFKKAVATIAEKKTSGAIVDLGCFIPYLPVALSLLGYKVKIVDNYKLYSPGFYSAIVAVAEEVGIELFDLDILHDDFSALGKNDVVLLMAVVEHFNGSPRELMAKTHKLLNPDGFMLFEVPNIANFNRRIGLFFGRSPLAHYPDYFNSVYPFTGHNREMTVREVEYLFHHSQFNLTRLECYDYSQVRPVGLKGWIMALLKRLTPMPNKQEVIMAVATSAQGKR